MLVYKLLLKNTTAEWPGGDTISGWSTGDGAASTEGNDACRPCLRRRRSHWLHGVGIIVLDQEPAMSCQRPITDMPYFR